MKSIAKDGKEFLVLEEIIATRIRRRSIEKTDWFPEEVPPEFPGAYECDRCSKLADRPKLHYWSGKKWYISENTFKCAGPSLKRIEKYPWRWRGLTQDPIEENRLTVVHSGIAHE